MSAIYCQQIFPSPLLAAQALWCALREANIQQYSKLQRADENDQEPLSKFMCVREAGHFQEE